MSLNPIENFIQHQLEHPEQIIGAIKPIVEAKLKEFGGQDLDHDGHPDFQEAIAAAAEVEHGLSKLAVLTKAYRDKFAPPAKA